VDTRIVPFQHREVVYRAKLRTAIADPQNGHPGPRIDTTITVQGPVTDWRSVAIDQYSPVTTQCFIAGYGWVDPHQCQILIPPWYRRLWHAVTRWEP
jgi:hypothetical protein